MRIWIDILTPKQALFFWPVIEKLHNNGYEVLSTSRRYEQLDWIFNVIKIDTKCVGEFGGDTLFGKLLASSKRQTALLELFREKSPGIVLSSGSIEACRISYGFGVRHILVSDTPHSPVNKLCVPLSELVLTSSFIPAKEWTKYGIKRRNIWMYKSLDPVAWLRRISTYEDAVKGIELPENYVLVRTPESKASYILGRGLEETFKLLNLLKKMHEYSIVIMTRYKDEAEIFRQKFQYKDAILLDKPVIAAPIIKKASLILSGGGTIAQEAALLGKPTIMYYPGKLPAVHRFLAKIGLIKILPPNKIDRVLSLSRRLTDKYVKKEIEKKAEWLMKSFEDPAEYVYRVIKSLLD